MAKEEKFTFTKFRQMQLTNIPSSFDISFGESDTEGA